MFLARSAFTRLRASGADDLLLTTSSLRLNSLVSYFWSRLTPLFSRDYQTVPGRRSGSRAVQPIFFISIRPSSLAVRVGEGAEASFGGSRRGGGKGGGGNPREPIGGGGKGRELRDPVLRGGGGGGGGGKSVPDWTLETVML
jgi:hypothetical protein